MQWSRRTGLHLLVGLVALVWLGVALSSLEDSIADWGDDWAHYASQARGLAEGEVEHAIALARFRNAWSSEPFGPTVAPWGFPLLLAPVHAWTDGDLWWLKVPSCVLYALFLVTLFLLTEGRLSDPARVLLVAIFALDPALFRFQNELLSDIPFLFYSTASLLLIDRCIHRREFYCRPAIDLSLLGLLIVLACSTRAVGSLLLLTFAGTQAIRWLRDRPLSWVAYLRERSAELLVYVVALFGLLLVSLLLPTAGTGLAAQFAYLGEESAAELLARFAQRISSYALASSEFFRSAAIPRGIELGLGLLTLALASIGALRRIAQDAVLLVYAALYAGLLVVTDFFDGLRYLFPLLPLLLYFAMAGLCPLVRRLGVGAEPIASARLGVVYASVVVAVFLAHVVVVSGRPARQPPSFQPFGADGSGMLAEIRSRTREDDVVAFLKPRAMTYLTGRRSIVVTRFDQLLDGRADYLVLLMGPVRDQLPVPDPFWIERRGDYELVYQNPRYLIFDLKPDPTSAAQRSPG